MNPDLSLADAKLALAVAIHGLEDKRVFWHTLRVQMSAASQDTKDLIDNTLTAIAAEKTALVEMTGIFAAL